MKTLLIILAVALVALYYSFDEAKHSTYPPGILVNEEPRQTLVYNKLPWQYKEFTVTPLAGFQMRGRVLHTERYWFDGGSVVSPIDFAVGWGVMSDQTVIDELSFSQGQRWYRWSPKKRPLSIPLDDVNAHSANMHMIPSGPEVAKVLRSVRRGDLISLSGDLVQVESEDGWLWRSSLTRADSGNGACELVWVERLTIH